MVCTLTITYIASRLPKIKQWIDENNPGDLLIPFSASLEEQLYTLNEDDAKQEYLSKLGEGVQSSLGKITKSGYDGLDLIRYFTAGPDEVRAWSIRRGIKAPQAAGVIHSDFENKFVCGEIMAFDDLKEAGSEAACRANGKLAQKGKLYEMVDGDIAQYVSSCARKGSELVALTDSAGSVARKEWNLVFILALCSAFMIHTIKHNENEKITKPRHHRQISSCSLS